MKKVGIVMGSDSDLPVIKKATDQLAGLGIPFEAHVYSAHRTPAEARDFALNARKTWGFPLRRMSTPPTGRRRRRGISH